MYNFTTGAKLDRANMLYQQRSPHSCIENYLTGHAPFGGKSKGEASLSAQLLIDVSPAPTQKPPPTLYPFR